MVRPLFKTTVVIWSEEEPGVGFIGNDLGGWSLTDLARHAEEGDAYCSSTKTEWIKEPNEDPDWDGTEFFGGDEECSNPHCNGDCNLCMGTGRVG